MTKPIACYISREASLDYACPWQTAVEDRKDWLRAFKPGTHADYNVESVTYENFVNKELILFSVSRLSKRLHQL